MRLTGTVYRAHHPRWSWDCESGAGAAHDGGRFNPVGMPALYTSLHVMTAVLEISQGFPYKGIPASTLCAYDVDCDDILDLIDPAILAKAGAAPSDLACAWKGVATLGGRPPSWTLATRLTAAGIAGVVVPSFAVGATLADRNVVFWRWSRDHPHRVAVIDPDRRLPDNDASWPRLPA